MSANTNPVFVRTPFAKSVVISTANTALSGAGTIVDVTAVSNDGCRVDGVQIIAQGTTTAGQINFFIYSGSAWEIFDSIAVSAVTPSGTTLPFKTTWTPPFDVLTLPSTHKLGAAVYNSETFSVHAEGGYF